VAIADVSFYVKPGTALDDEAKNRGNSVYFPSAVIPMLPEVLSNGLCSLNPNVERLCMVCVLDISPVGKVIAYEFHEGLMRSHARLTYTKVAALLTPEHNETLKEEYAHLLPHLHHLYKLYHVLKKEREVRGAIEFETVETRIIFGPDGKINKVEPTQRNDAHRLIEECMLCANVACAQFLNEHKMPALYRNHEGPPEEKLNDLKTFLQELGLSLGGGEKPKPLDYAKLLSSAQNRPDVNIIQSILLRSLSQAVYSPDNIGHFGLAYPAYCHFTSPIRRYPDLLVHRQIRSILRNQWGEKEKAAANTEEAKEALASLGDYTSMTERRADDATRDAIRWLKCEYIQKHIGEEFAGIISGVTRFGFFVELKDIYIDGLIHVTSLRNDFYAFDQIHHRLIGERSGTIFKLGDSVRVRVGKVNVDERKIDFDLIDLETTTKGKPGERARKGKSKPDSRSKTDIEKQTKDGGYHGKQTKAHKEKEAKKAKLTKRPPKSKGNRRRKPTLGK
jgi:ribonuclease R